MSSVEISSFSRIEQRTKSYQRPTPASKKEPFQQLFEEKTRKVNVSNHAKKRLDSRNLYLEQADFQQLNQAMNELEEKGSKESLLVYKEIGLIANIQNRTIITAMDMEELHTITNIDSAKFIK